MEPNLKITIKRIFRDNNELAKGLTVNKKDALELNMLRLQELTGIKLDFIINNFEQIKRLAYGAI